MSVENTIRVGDAPARIQAAAQVAAYRAAAAIHTHAVSLTPTSVLFTELFSLLVHDVLSL